MLRPTREDIAAILADYGLHAPVTGVTELQRNSEYGPDSRELRLILRVDTAAGSLVLRCRNEGDLPMALAEAQSRFAQRLRASGIETPRAYRSGDAYTRQHTLQGCTFLVNLEDFAPGELTAVDEKTAEETGALLARMHQIAEREDLHVPGPVLFDPLTRNDLFRREDFTSCEAFLTDLAPILYRDIQEEADRLFTRLSPLGEKPRFAVQGDISDCNLYRTAAGRLGVFDFNRCGENLPFFDAVMQAVFEARLMDYPPELGADREERILAAFLRGYHRERPFTREERALYSCLYALMDAFWLGDLRWDRGSLLETAEAGDREGGLAWLETIRRRIHARPEMPL